MPSSRAYPGLERAPGKADQFPWNKGRSKYATEEEKLEAKRAANRRWARNRNPEDRRRWNLHNKERRRGHVHDPEWDRVLRADPCSYCGGTSEGVDHVVPVVAGGDTSADNLVGACNRCNGAKHTKSLLEFLLNA